MAKLQGALSQRAGQGRTAKDGAFGEAALPMNRSHHGGHGEHGGNRILGPPWPP